MHEGIHRDGEIKGACGEQIGGGRFDMKRANPTSELAAKEMPCGRYLADTSPARAGIELPRLGQVSTWDSS